LYFNEAIDGSSRIVAWTIMFKEDFCLLCPAP
jgi:hypothetical protein